MTTTDTPTALEDGLRLAQRLRDRLPVEYVADDGALAHVRGKTESGSGLYVDAFASSEGIHARLHVAEPVGVAVRRFAAGEGGREVVALAFGRDTVYVSPSQAVVLAQQLVAALVGVTP